MNKTANRVLAAVLSIVMVFSCFTAAFAANGFVYTSKGRIDLFSPNDSVTKVVDLIDNMLKEENIRFDLKEETDLPLNIVLDLTTVDNVMKTMDKAYDILYIDTFLGTGENPIWSTAKLLMGDLRDLSLAHWTSGLTRKGSGDQKILEELIELINDNSNLIGKFVENNITFGSALDGIIGIEDGKIMEESLYVTIKRALLEVAYDVQPDQTLSEAEQARFDADLKNRSFDDILFNDLLDSLFSDEDFPLPGVKFDQKSTLDDVIKTFAQSAWKNQLATLISEMDVQYDPEYPLAYAFRTVLKIDFVNNETPAVPFDSSFDFAANKSYLAQVDSFMKFVVEQFVIDAEGDPFVWNVSTSGYGNIGENIKNLCMYLLKHADFTGTSYETYVKDLLSGDPTFEEVALAVLKVVLAEFAQDFNTEGVKNSNSLYEVAYNVVKKLTNDMGIAGDYPCQDNADAYIDACFDMCADMIAFSYSKTMPLVDDNGKAYKVGGGASFEQVVNYIANYFLFGKEFNKVLKLNCKKTDSPYKKVDCIISMLCKGGTSKFDSEKLLVGKGTEKGILRSLFTLDIQNIFDRIIVDATTAAGTKPVVKIVYLALEYFLDNFFNIAPANISSDGIIAEYAATNPIDNALKDKNLGRMVKNLLRAIYNNKAGLVPTVCYILFIVLSDDGTIQLDPITNVKVSDATYDGTAKKPEVAITANGKKLVAGKDFVATYSNNKAVGKGSVSIVGTEYIEGTYDATFNIKPASISSATMSVSGTVDYTGKALKPKVTLTLGKVKLVEGTDFTCAYTNNTNPGKATVTATGIGNYTGKVSKTFYIRPTWKVSGLAQSAGTSTTVSLKWSAVKGATGYKVENYASSKWTACADTAKTTLKVEKLSAGKTYSYRVTPYLKLSDGKVLYGNPTSTFKAKTASAAVTGLKQKSQTSKSITVTWTAVKGASKYEVYLLSGGKWALNQTVTKNTATISGLAGNTGYSVRVKAITADSTLKINLVSDYSATLVVRTSVGTCSSLKLSEATATSVKLTWKAVKGATSYVVYRNDGKKGYTKVATVKTNSVTIKSLKAATSYKYAVTPVVKDGSVSFTGTRSADLTVTTLFTKVSSVTAKGGKTTSITLNWKKVSGATSYGVYMYNAKSKTYKLYKTVKTNSCTVSKLSAGTTYSFKVMALKGKIKGEYSSVVKFSTAPTQTKGLKSSNVWGTSLKLSWTKVTGATKYEVYRGDAKGKKFVKVGESKTNSITVAKLTKNTKYTFKVRAVISAKNGTLNGAYSSNLSVTTRNSFI